MGWNCCGKGTTWEGNAEPMLLGKPVSCAVYNDAVAAAVSNVKVWD